MNKQEAATILGVSVRTLESYVAQERLPVRYVKGKTRPVADFEADDLERLQAELAQGTVRLQETQTSRAKDSRNLATNSATSQQATAELAHTPYFSAASSIVVMEAAHFQELLGAMNSATSQNPQNLAAKMLLTLAEVQNLTGLSRETLKQAIRDGLLPAKQMGRAWRLRPEDVREWIRTSFE